MCIYSFIGYYFGPPNVFPKRPMSMTQNDCSDTNTNTILKDIFISQDSLQRVAKDSNKLTYKEKRNIVRCRDLSSFNDSYSTNEHKLSESTAQQDCPDVWNQNQF